MKLTDDIVKALHYCIEDGYESVSDFARRANVRANTITKYLRHESESMKEDTWKKLQPLLHPYLQKGMGRKAETFKRPADLNADQKVLLDAFNDLTPEQQQNVLFEVIEEAKANLKKR